MEEPLFDLRSVRAKLKASTIAFKSRDYENILPLMPAEEARCGTVISQTR